MTKEEFFKIEHQVCHAKMTQAVDYLIKIELFTLLAIGAIYAWYPKYIQEGQGATVPTWIVLWIPFLFSLIAVVRSTMQRKYIGAVSEYLADLEAEVSPFSSVGWETWYDKNKPKRWNEFYRRVLWPTLILGTFSLAVLGTFLPQVQHAS
ncbi:MULTISPECIES: hypothetical protein [Hyphomonas]|jgi:hypothetical protein|uniref:hypothetical protein n=1 Tax=Hyphomonas TaxID=85 RepID=UPI0035163915|tara:strand:+ start:2099 stop:2548 length:450 start_codon:yes stop_codon:yes gene_type:complete